MVVTESLCTDPSVPLCAMRPHLSVDGIRGQASVFNREGSSLAAA